MRDCHVDQVIDLPNPLIGLLRLWISKPLLRRELGIILGPKASIEEELGIFPSPKASIEGAKSRAYIGGGSENVFRDGKLENYSKSKCLYRKEMLGIFQSSKTYIEGESSEFFQVPELI